MKQTTDIDEICDKRNHFTKICQSKVKNQRCTTRSIEDEKATMDDLIVHVTSSRNGYLYVKQWQHSRRSRSNNIFTTPLTQVKDEPNSSPMPAGPWKCYHHTLGTKTPTKHRTHCEKFNPIEKKVRAVVGVFSLMCRGWLLIIFTVEERSTKQALYICKKIET